MLFHLAWARTPAIEPVIVELGADRGRASLLLGAGLLGKTKPKFISVAFPTGDPIDVLFVNAAPDNEKLHEELLLWAPSVKAGGIVALRGASRESLVEKLQPPQFDELRSVENLVWAVKQCGPSPADATNREQRLLDVALEAMLHLNTMPAFAEADTRPAAARLQDYVVRSAREIAEERHAVEALRRSWSWRITAALRLAVDVFQTANGLLAARSSVSGFTQWIRYRKQLRTSGLLDERYYRTQNAGVAWAGASPLLHFLVCGAAEGKNPNELFDTEYYVRRYPDVANSDLNPLVHYLTRGAYAGFDPHPYFDSSFYLEQNPDVSEAGLNPLAHYLAPGIAEGRDPNPWFDTSEYLEQNTDVAVFGLNPLTHQLKQARQGRDRRACSRS